MSTREPPTRGAVESRLRQAAEEFARERGMRVSPASWAVLDRFLSRAVRQMADEDRLDDPTAIAEAEANLRRVLGAAASRSTRRREKPNPLLAPLRRRTQLSPSIDGLSLYGAFRSLCPIWPFCKRPRP